jgi:hypothetical protein
MNLALERRKEELAAQYILDPRQKEIFLTKATQHEMWANYIAGLILASESYSEFHISNSASDTEIAGEPLRRIGARESSL